MSPLVFLCVLAFSWDFDSKFDVSDFSFSWDFHSKFDVSDLSFSWVFDSKFDVSDLSFSWDFDSKFDVIDFRFSWDFDSKLGLVGLVGSSSLLACAVSCCVFAFLSVLVVGGGGFGAPLWSFLVSLLSCLPVLGQTLEIL